MTRKLLPAALLALFAACTPGTHPVKTSTLGTLSSSGSLTARMDQPGPLEVESIVSADWAVTRAGLINLDHPKAKAAELKDGDEPIEIFFHVIRHPTRGTFIIDTGVEKALRDAPDKSAISALVRSAMHTEKMKVRTALGDWLAQQPTPLEGIFLTHVHLDHISGLPDAERSTPIYAGPGELTSRGLLNLFVRGTVDKELSGFSAINEWPFAADPDGRFAGVVDVFGDGSFWAISTPGHTPGSTAYLARTATGAVLYTGDASHTAWGWENSVEPGTFSSDIPQSRRSFEQLRKLSQEHPAMVVKLGHQEHAAVAAH
jgi:N-acyl homoserine lactone hydrolase